LDFSNLIGNMYRPASRQAHLFGNKLADGVGFLYTVKEIENGFFFTLNAAEQFLRCRSG
jgi:hypothetical protein